MNHYDVIVIDHCLSATTTSEPWPKATCDHP